MTQNLSQTQKIQNDIFIRDTYETFAEQNFMFFIGNHPYLYEEFITQGQMTQAEMLYINDHFHDYDVDPRTFESEFKRILRESLPRYNMLKGIELRDEIFELVTDKYTREIYSKATSSLASEGNTTRTGNNSSNTQAKEANRQTPMQSTGQTFDGTVNWQGGASMIDENHTNISNVINESDRNVIENNGESNNQSTETYKRDDDPVEHVARIWNYIVKPKAINWLTAELAAAFILVY